jgi:Zn-dependent protease with chaperone function
MCSDETTIEIEGRLSQAELAQSVPVFVTLEAEGLSVKRRDRSQLAFWRFSNLRPAARIRTSDADVFLHNTQTPRAILLLKGSDVAKDLVTRAPQIVPSRLRKLIVGLGVFLIVVVIAFVLFILLGRERYPKTLAQLIPYQLVDKLGEQSAQMFLRIGSACHSERGIKALRKVVTRLTSASPNGRPFILHVARSPMATAFALPGHHIVLLSGLVNEARNADEVAGVIAHEMGHELSLDPEALFVKTAGSEAIIELLTGEPDAESALIFNSALLQLRYNAKEERLADKYTLRILHNAGVSPRPMGQFLLRHTIGLRPLGGSLQYVSTHPAPDERTKLYSAQPDYETTPVLTSTEWADAKSVCEDETTETAETNNTAK